MAVPPFSTIPQMTFKVFTPADGLVEVVEKVQYNFDQVLLYGGGPKGDKGDPGDKGLPGATGIGTKGDPGRRGSFIFFPGTTVNNGDLVSNPDHWEEDVIIDVDGDYFQVEENPGTGDLEYIFKFNINTASLNTYWIDQDSWIASSAQPINEYLRLDDTSLNHNLLVGRRTDNGGGFDKAEFYRLLVGLDTYPFGGSQEIPLVICNVLPNSVDAANDNPFYHVAFKYRESSGSNVGANTVFVKYTEQAASFNRYLFSVENASVGMFLRHDTNDTDDSEVLVRGHHMKLIGKSTSIDSITEWLDIQIDANLATVTAQKDLIIKPDSPAVGDFVRIQHNRLELDALAGTPTITTVNAKDLVITTDGAAQTLFITNDASEWLGDTLDFYANNTSEFIIRLQDDLRIQSQGGQLWLEVPNVYVDLNTNIVLENGDVTVSQGTSGIEWIFEAELHIKGRTKIEQHSAVVEIGISGLVDISGIESTYITLEENGTTGQTTVTGITGGKDGQIIILEPDVDMLSSNQVYLDHDSGASGELQLAARSAIPMQRYMPVILRYNQTLDEWRQIGGYTETNMANIFYTTFYSGNMNNMFDAGLFRQGDSTIQMSNGSPPYAAAGDGYNQYITEVIRPRQNGSPLGTIQIQYSTPWQGAVISPI